MPWNAISWQGNPARSIEVNTLIKKVRKRKFENKGLAPRLDIMHLEFRRMQSILRDSAYSQACTCTK